MHEESTMKAMSRIIQKSNKLSILNKDMSRPSRSRIAIMRNLLFLRLQGYIHMFRYVVLFLASGHKTVCLMLRFKGQQISQ